MALMVVIMGLGLLFNILLGFRQLLCNNTVLVSGTIEPVEGAPSRCQRFGGQKTSFQGLGLRV